MIILLRKWTLALLIFDETQVDCTNSYCTLWCFNIATETAAPLRFTLGSWDGSVMYCYSKSLLSGAFLFWGEIHAQNHVMLYFARSPQLYLFLVSDAVEVIQLKCHVFPDILFVQLHFAIWDVSRNKTQGPDFGLASMYQKHMQYFCVYNCIYIYT